jgi:hypothetical protein
MRVRGDIQPQEFHNLVAQRQPKSGRSKKNNNSWLLNLIAQTTRDDFLVFHCPNFDALCASFRLTAET